MRWLSQGATLGGDLKWSYGMPGERLLKALREWQVLRHPGDQYQMVNSSGEDICRVLAALGVNLRPVIYTIGSSGSRLSTEPITERGSGMLRSRVEMGVQPRTEKPRFPPPN